MPTVRGIPGPYRFYFFSFDCREPCHVHIQRERLRCKFWLSPLRLTANAGFSARELAVIRSYIEEHEKRIREVWDEHCGR
jgi:hypothetical protein